MLLKKDVALEEGDVVLEDVVKFCLINYQILFFMSGLGGLFETSDGGRWLRKAFNPEGVDAEVNGLPDSNIAACCTLNYVGKYDVPLPRILVGEAAQNNAYDSVIYLTHDPVVPGACATYPTGTEDIRKANLTFHFDKAVVDVVHTSGQAFCPRTCRQFVNSQIPGVDINAKRTYLCENSQRYRTIYGAAKLIPLCSEDYNSGSISICQSLMSPQYLGTKGNMLGTLHYQSGNVELSRDSNNPFAAILADSGNHKQFCKVEETPTYLLNDDDFPDPEDAIQYPNAYYDRYAGGAYIPYKLLNAFNCKYISTENKNQVRVPYWVTGIAYTSTPIVATFGNVYDTTATFNPATTDAAYATAEWIEMQFNMQTQTFVGEDLPQGRTHVEAYAVHCTSYFGLDFDYIIWCAPAAAATFNENSVLNYKLPPTCTPYGAHYTTIYTLGPNIVFIIGHTNALRPTTAHPGPYTVYDFMKHAQNVITIHCTSINISASTQLYLRLGMELQSTGNSAFSTIRHTSPPYDETALKSYTRVMQGIKDALPGDAITPGGQEAYYKYIAGKLTSFVRTRYINNGAPFTGKVSVK